MEIKKNNTATKNCQRSWQVVEFLNCVFAQGKFSEEKIIKQKEKKAMEGKDCNGTVKITRNKASLSCIVCDRMFIRKGLKLFHEGSYGIVNGGLLSEKKDSVAYICCKCDEKLRGTSLKKKLTKEEKEQTYLCTCCHKWKNDRRQVVKFNKQTFDFKLPCVQEALCVEFRKKASVNEQEYICRSCHVCLSKKHTTPSSAACLRSNVCASEHINWNDLLKKMQECQDF